MTRKQKRKWRNNSRRCIIFLYPQAIFKGSPSILDDDVIHEDLTRHEPERYCIDLALAVANASVNAIQGYRIFYATFFQDVQGIVKQVS
ncbi:MAG: hypothetical protein ACTSUE_18810 [Promethearchaeota archaeon]